MLRLIKKYSSVLIAAAIAGIAGYWLFGISPETSDLVPAEAGANKVSPNSPPSMTVKAEPIEIVTITNTQKILGVTHADRIAVVSAQTSGRIESIDIQEGDWVARNTKLATLAMDAREEKIAEAEALLKQRELELESSRRLEKSGYQASLNISQAEAAVAQALSALKHAQLELERRTLNAPIAGYVETVHVEIGELASFGTPVARIVDLTPTVVTFQLIESQIKDLNIGDTISVTIGDLSTEGRIRKIATVAEPETRTYEVEASVKTAPDTVIRAGQTAVVLFSQRPKQGTLISPASLVLSTSGKLGVKIVGADSKVAFVAVELIREDASGAWITGVEEGQLLITNGQGFVDIGESVQMDLSAAQSN